MTKRSTDKKEKCKLKIWTFMKGRKLFFCHTFDICSLGKNTTLIFVHSSKILIHLNTTKKIWNDTYLLHLLSNFLHLSVTCCLCSHHRFWTRETARHCHFSVWTKSFGYLKVFLKKLQGHCSKCTENYTKNRRMFFNKAVVLFLNYWCIITTVHIAHYLTLS